MTARSRAIEGYFEQTASYWDEVYGRADVWGEIYRHRQVLTLLWIDQLGLEGGSRVLDVGCGAGLTTVMLARRAFRVDAIDPAAAMISLTRRRAAEARVEDLITARLGDAQCMDFSARTFRLVLALGVLPWVPSPVRLVREISRVVEPGGYVLLTADNRTRLAHLIDPTFNPALAPLVKPMGTMLRRSGLRKSPGEPAATMHVAREVDEWLAVAGLTKVAGVTFGFGPLTLLGHPLLPERASVHVHRWLQRVADRRLPLLKSIGAQYIVLARRDEARE